MSVRKIVSGGQTGADRAALDVALELDLATGGWVPLGRRADDGEVPARYEGLVETESPEYSIRTELNVRDSDATVVFAFGPPGGGTELTVRAAERYGKSLLVIDLEGEASERLVAELREWLATVRPRVLNVAGPRLSEEPRIYVEVAGILNAALVGLDVDTQQDGRR